MAKQSKSIDFAAMKPARPETATKQGSKSELRFVPLPTQGKAWEALEAHRKAEKALVDAYEADALNQMVQAGDIPAINFYPAISRPFPSSRGGSVVCGAGGPMKPEDYAAHRAAKKGK